MIKDLFDKKSCKLRGFDGQFEQFVSKPLKLPRSNANIWLGGLIGLALLIGRFLLFQSKQLNGARQPGPVPAEEMDWT